jgi:site-specific DNA recombinase
MKIAIYLRVSTLDQATKGNTNRDGFSIPAQREACRRKAKDLGATVIKEYADRGESARSAARPELQRLLQDLCDKKGIKYVIVHKVDRLARNLHDDVTIGLAIQKGGAQLVSVTENIDETPSGRLLHGIMATIAEFYSRNLAAEALKGATEKAKQGGTPYQAPIGYANVTERTNRREIHTVGLDTVRAPLIRWAFERYATGDYSELRLAKELSKRGLRSRLRARSRVESISHSGLNKMLSNRYYLGYITYCGVEYKGNHQPLVTPAVFAACEAVRASRYMRENRHRKHYPYLSRLLLCGKCQRHLCYMVSRKPNRDNYEYFFCMNRRDNGCPQVYIPLQLVKEAVTNVIKQLKFSDNDRQKLTIQISKELTSEQRYAETDVKQQTGRRDRLLAERDNVMQAYYDKVIQDSLLKSEQRRIAKEIEQAEAVITEAEERLAIINARRDRALELAQGLDIGKAYVKANEDIKRHFCLALFSKIEIDDNPVYHGHEFRAPRDHHVRVTTVRWHDPINIRHITEAILALSLERGKKAVKPKKILP